MSLLAAHDIAVHFGGVKAVDGVSFHVDEGEVFAIIGPNGAGKSTIFNLISRFYPLTHGRIEFAGEDVTGLKAHQIAPWASHGPSRTSSFSTIPPCCRTC
jgi:branched-chain amino acid transport system ATP-binding protein